MTREDVATKGRRYLLEARLVVKRVSGGEIEATCRGDSGQVYRLGHVTGRWYCDCPSLGRCSHLVALQLCTIMTGRPPSPPSATRSEDPGSVSAV